MDLPRFSIYFKPCLTRNKKTERPVLKDYTHDNERRYARL